MIKRMTLLRRRQGMSTDAFRAHWAGQHADLALSLPGVVGYTQNRVTRDLLHDRDGRRFDVDGIVELAFADMASMAIAQRTEAGAVLIPADEPLFLSGWTLCIVDDGGDRDRDGHGGLKVMVPLAIGDEDRRSIAQVLARGSGLGQAVSGFSLNTVRSVARREALWREPIAPTCIVTIWCAGDGEAAAAVAPSGILGPYLARTEVAGAVVVDALIKR